MNNSADVWCAEHLFQAHFPDGHRQDVPVDLAYRASDPTVISLRFPDAENECPWVIGRDLLRDGLLNGTTEKPVGLGDVKVWTAGDEVWISFSTPSGSIKMSSAEQPFAEFVFETYEHVSDEDQWGVDVEKLLADLPI